MTPLRTFWVAWCCCWALGWLLLGFFTIITWLFVPFSLLAILVPVGQAPPPTPFTPVACPRCNTWVPAVEMVNHRCWGQS